MTGLKAQLNRKLHECGRDPLSLFLLGCVIAAALITFMVLSFYWGIFVAGAAKYRNRFVCFAV